MAEAHYAALLSQAQSAFKAGQLDQARELTNILCKQRLSLTPEACIELCLLAGKLKRAAGDFESASLAFEQALSCARQHSLLEPEAHTLNQLASIHSMQGNDEAALDALGGASKLFELLGLNKMLAPVLTNMGCVYHELADYENALSALQKSYQILKTLAPRSRTAAINLQNLGATYSALSNFEEAEKLLEESLAIANELDDQEVYIAAQIILGDVCITLGKLDKAEAAFDSAQARSAQQSLAVYEIGATLGLGNVYFEQTNYRQAARLHAKASSLASSIGDQLNRGVSLLKLSKDELALEQYQEAIEHAETALAIAAQTERTRLQYEAHQALAEAYKSRGDYESTVFHLEAFHALRETVFNEDNAEKTRRLSLKFDLEKARHESEMYRLESEMSAQAQEKAERLVQERTVELESAQLEIVNRLAVAAEYRDDDTGAHTRRVGRTAAVMAYAMGWPLRDVQLLYTAARLHDVGKIGISDKILLKPSSLTDEELKTMKTHTLIGELILANGHSPLLKMAERIAIAHHERWDGNGYPNGLVATAIPEAARIVSVADVLDALTHERPYKRAWTVEEALSEIQNKSGTQFAPDIVTVCLTIFGAAGPLSPLKVAESWQDLLDDLEKVQAIRNLTTKKAQASLAPAT